MPKKISRFAQEEQPIRWGRAFFCGILSAIFMMSFIDCFYMMGMTPFSMEEFLGSLIRATPYGAHNWVLGFLANCLVGGVFGILYAYFFEYSYYQTSSRLGVKLSFWHILFAAVVVFPFFASVHEFMGTGLYPQFGVLGAGLGALTPLLIILGHLLFGASMGTFYGPVRSDRVQDRYFESGETGLFPVEGALLPEEDPQDRIAV